MPADAIIKTVHMDSVAREVAAACRGSVNAADAGAPDLNDPTVSLVTAARPVFGKVAPRRGRPAALRSHD